MTNQIDQIVEHLFHKKNLDDVSIYELERFIAIHPYFAAGHLLLAKKAQADQSADTQDKASTVALYYNNHLWLQWLLNQDVHSRQGKQYQTDVAQQNGHDTESEEAMTEKTTVETVEVTETDSAIEIDFLEPQPENKRDDAQVAEDEFAPALETEHEVLQNERELPTDHSPPEVHEEHVIDSKEAAREVKDYSEQYNSHSQSVENPNKDQTEFVAAEISTETADQEERNEETSDDSPVRNTDLEAAEEKALTAGIERTLSAATLIPTRAEIENNEFTFEPYHTIDYFASQGIKLQQSDFSKDKFGKQLKSFTEWLRSMKRLPQPSADGAIDEATQHSIQVIAEHSFEEKEIVTETMAEVWIKQGNKEKAIDTLHKLSLQNPSKSHYFAAKIEQLKAS